MNTLALIVIIYLALNWYLEYNTRKVYEDSNKKAFRLLREIRIGLETGEYNFDDTINYDDIINGKRRRINAINKFLSDQGDSGGGKR